MRCDRKSCWWSVESRVEVEVMGLDFLWTLWKASTQAFDLALGSWTRRSSTTVQPAEINLKTIFLSASTFFRPCLGLFWRAIHFCLIKLARLRFFTIFVFWLLNGSARCPLETNHIIFLLYFNFLWFIKILFSFEIPSFIQSSWGTFLLPRAPVINLETFNADRPRVKNNLACDSSTKTNFFFCLKISSRVSVKLPFLVESERKTWRNESLCNIYRHFVRRLLVFTFGWTHLSRRFTALFTFHCEYFAQFFFLTSPWRIFKEFSNDFGDIYDHVALINQHILHHFLHC